MLKKNGDEIFRGTKQEVDEFVARLKKMPEAEAKKLIDELIRSVPKLTSDKQFWTCINISGTQLRWNVK